VVRLTSAYGGRVSDLWRLPGASISVGRFMPAPAEQAWALVSHTATWSAWGPTISAVEPAGEALRLGLRGRVRTSVGLWLPFQITAFDPPRSWAWSIRSIPATNHVVTPAPGGCRVSFAVPTPAFAYLAVCRLALERIAVLLDEIR